jgi:hypothetical protein
MEEKDHPRAVFERRGAVEHLALHQIEELNLPTRAQKAHVGPTKEMAL